MRLLACVALVLIGASGAARAQFTVEGYDPGKGAFLVEGKEAQFEWAGNPAAKFRVVYRPNTKIEETVELGTAADKRYRFTPKVAGLLNLVAYVGAEAVATKTLSVRFASTLGVGLVVMLFAALVLFGGALVSIRALLRAGS